MPQVLEESATRQCVATGRGWIAAEWHDDRWLLSGGLGHGADAIVLFQETEPAIPDDERRVANPVFQQCHARVFGDKAELLLVGLCGKRHFSGVLAATDHEVIFEAADRRPADAALEQIGFRWRLPSARSIELDGRDARITADATKLLITPVGDDLSPKPEGEGVLSLSAQFDSQRQPPLTVTYGLRLELGSDTR
ncbi:hypothetical protein Pan216_14440 [Planctomycetes bacterium Pan216]|uniref:Uncharacterized protein n=1 Tax=Kolteria novifilia TaxID=2527975 RepID=A0A518B0W3_9BACT|nr:hypothetical protein Pan216_14440 [Planctomycetes bacterium Pan216]